jgi:hypothetical protein
MDDLPGLSGDDQPVNSVQQEDFAREEEKARPANAFLTPRILFTARTEFTR